MTIRKTLTTAVFAIMAASGAMSLASTASAGPSNGSTLIPPIPCIWPSKPGPSGLCTGSDPFPWVKPTARPAELSRFDRFRVEKGVFSAIDMNGIVKK